jgi:hypothetical protein
MSESEVQDDNNDVELIEDDEDDGLEAPEPDEVAQFIEDNPEWEHLRAIIRDIGWEPSEVTGISEGYGQAGFDTVELTNPDGDEFIIARGYTSRASASAVQDMESEFEDQAVEHMMDDESTWVPSWLRDTTGLEVESTRDCSLNGEMTDSFREWCRQNVDWRSDLSGNRVESGVAESQVTDSQKIWVGYTYWEP